MEAKTQNTDATRAGYSVGEWGLEAYVSRASVTKLIADPGPERLKSIRCRGKRVILESPREYFERLYALQSSVSTASSSGRSGRLRRTANDKIAA